jgi:NADPH-dependent 2,4-dienoyl-CoA reductase/sulfur reductase-like enzyme
VVSTVCGSGRTYIPLAGNSTLRRRGYDGELTVIGDEPHPPYDRPPLSKQILAGTWEPGRAFLRPDEELARLGAGLRLGRAATTLDLTSHQVHLDDGEPIGFDGLIIATGVTPRRLPGSDLAGVHVLRTLDDG